MHGSLDVALLVPMVVAAALFLGGLRTLHEARVVARDRADAAGTPQSAAAVPAARAARAAATAPELPELVTALPAGDADHGRELFRRKHGCALCHGDPAVPGSQLRAPDLSAIARVGAQRVPGQSAAQYVYESIVDPDAYRAEAPVAADGTKLEAMPVPTLTAQEAADLVAYLLRAPSQSPSLDREPSTAAVLPSAD